MPLFPPRHICIAGALAITAGVGSVIGMIAGLVSSSFSFDLGFVGIPIGYGILIGRSSSRRWAIFFAAAGTLIVAGFGGWAFFNHFSGRGKLPYPDGAYTATELVIALACSVYVLIILTRQTNREWFDSLIEDSAPSKSLAWAVTVTSAVLLVSHHAAEWWVEETHAQIFSFRVTVTPYNAETGEGLSSVTYDSDAISLSSASKRNLPKVGVSFIGGPDGMKLDFSGVATHPVEVTVKSEGFHDVPITLNQDTEDEIRISMSPVGTTQPEGVGGQPATPPPVSD